MKLFGLTFLIGGVLGLGLALATLPEQLPVFTVIAIAVVVSTVTAVVVVVAHRRRRRRP